MRAVVRAAGPRGAYVRHARHVLGPIEARTLAHPLVALASLNDAVSWQQRRSKSTHPAANTSSPPSFSSRRQQQQSSPGRDGVVAQLQRAVARAASHPLDLEALRGTATLLQAAHTPEQLRAALPLCRLVEQADAPLHGSATAECVRIYEALGRHREAVELALRLLRNDFFLMNPVLTSALQACAALRDSDRGFELFELALERGTIPNRNVFGALLALSAAAGDAPRAPRVTRLLAQMTQGDDTIELNHTTFHHWMTSFAKADKFEYVEELFETIEEYGLAPVEATFAIMMDAFAERGDYDKTMALLAQLKKRKDLSVGLVHYNVALKVCGKTSKLTQAFHLYEEMKKGGKATAPDLVTYITMMHAVYHGELGVVDTRTVKAAMGGVGALALASVPFIDFQEQLMTVLFCSSLVGSMGLAVYMNPDGAMRALYPNSDEPQNDTVIEAFFRRLREEDHCGRSMYLWREMLKHGVAPDSRVQDVLVRTCVKKRHPELAFEAVFEQQGVPLVDAESGQFVLPLATTVGLLHSLLAQRRVAMADAVFDTARAHRAFRDVFRESKDVYAYDLRAFNSATVRSYVVRRVLAQLHGESKLFGAGKAQLLPRVEFLALHGFDLLDQLDMDDPQVRALFSMDEMKRETTGRSGSHHNQQNHATTSAGNSTGQFFFRLNVPRERLAAFFAAPLASATQQKL